MEQSFALKRVKDVLWIIAIAGLIAMIGRTFFGLGASTNLTDGIPWGMWKILNMVAGVCLATGGFIVACAVYIFRLDKYRPLARAAVLVAFLGYGASCFALMWDIGLPHRVWHPLTPTMWNPHSFLFEVAMCVMLYWAVSGLELIPILTERLPFERITHFLHEIALPFVVLGITLSTLHHSSLGSLFMVSPTRLHPIWFSTWIPAEFFVSSVASGMAAIVLITIIWSKLYNKKLNLPMLSGMAGASAVTVVIYFIIRSVDFTLHDKWSYVFVERTWESYLFMAEVLIEVFIPVIIIAVPRWRRSIKGLTVATSFAVAGVVLYRLNVGIMGYFRDAGAVYIPSLSEVFFSLGVFAAAGIIFLFVVERFYIFESPEECAVPETEGVHADKAPQWTWDELLAVFTSPGAVRISLIIIITIPVSILLFSDTALKNFQFQGQEVNAAMGADEKREKLRLDGNRNDIAVMFPHELHKTAAYPDLDNSCRGCHHLDLPQDNASSCYHCHQDMWLQTDIFDHEYHKKLMGGNDSCNECHQPDRPKTRENSPSCYSCHKEDMNGMEKYKDKKQVRMAPGYYQVMHGKCLTCHRMIGNDPEFKKDPQGHGNCLFCHTGTEFYRE
ncbi:MAG: NrfD/PsrC family molybdoenzyme membrane anchor subunit [bacterium]